jgi:hypothetical protein
MTQQINVPGVGLLNFPDGMSDQDMAAAIQRNYPQLLAPQGGQAAPPSGGQPPLGSQVPVPGKGYTSPINSPPPPPANPSFLDQALGALNRYANYAKNIPAQAEMAAHLGSGLIAAPVSGIAGLGQIANNALGIGPTQDPAEVVAATQKALTYQPRTSDGKAIARAADKALGVVPEYLNKAGGDVTDAATKLGASPEVAAGLGTGLNVAGNAALMLLGSRGTSALRGAAGDAATDTAAAARAPAPASAPATPPTTPAALLQQSLDNGRQAGYVVPPNYDPAATGWQSLGQKLVGKASSEQAARIANQDVTNRLSATGLNQNPLGIEVSPQAALTKTVLQNVIQQAIDKGYTPLKDLDITIPADGQFLRENAAIKEAHGDELSGNADVASVADILQKQGLNGFDPAKLPDQISTLRSRAADAFSQGRSAAGTAFRKQASQLEALIDRSLQDADNLPPNLLQNYRAARQLIAKASTISDAVNPSTGNVDAMSLGQTLQDGTPLTGDHKIIADFANAAPRAASVPNGAPLPPTNPLVTAGSLIAAVPTHGLSLAAAILPHAQAFVGKWLMRHNSPGMLQPGHTGSYGQTALDAIHGSAGAFSKLYGGIAPDALATDTGNGPPL